MNASPDLDGLDIGGKRRHHKALPARYQFRALLLILLVNA